MKNSQLSNILLKVGCFFLLKSLYYQRLFVSLQHENPPSLSTMLKCAGRFIFLYISLAEILVFSNDSYFFVNIENMEENGNILIINGLWIYWLIALKQKFYSCTTITPIVVQLQGIRLIRNKKQRIRDAQNSLFSLLDSKFTSMQNLVINIDRNNIDY